MKDYIEKQIGCILPFSNASINLKVSDRVCSSEEDFQKFMNGPAPLFADAKEKDVLDVTGCQPSCHTEQYELHERWNLLDKNFLQ